MLDQHLLAARLWASMLASSKGLQNVLPHCLRTTEIESEKKQKHMKCLEFLRFTEIIEVDFFFCYLNQTCHLMQPCSPRRRKSKHLFEILLRVVVLMDCIYSSWLCSSSSTVSFLLFLFPSQFVCYHHYHHQKDERNSTCKGMSQ